MAEITKVGGQVHQITSSNYNLLANRPIVVVSSLPSSGADNTLIYKRSSTSKLYTTSDNGATWQEFSGGGGGGFNGTVDSIDLDPVTNNYETRVVYDTLSQAKTAYIAGELKDNQLVTVRDDYSNIVFTEYPDYTNYESSNNLILTNNGTYTVDRDGYYRLCFQAICSAQTQVRYRGYINGQIIYGELLDTIGTTYRAAFSSQLVKCSVGDVIQLAIEAISGGTISSYVIGCYYVPYKIKGISDHYVSYTKASELLHIGPPDYVHEEWTNLLTSPSSSSGTSWESSSWTVDRDGYVHLGASFNVSPDVTRIVEFYIDGALVKRYSNEYSAITIGDIYQVIKGNVVKVKCRTPSTATPSELTMECYFIPPVAQPNIYVSGSSLINYSLVEQDTGLKWVDGRTVYQKTYKGRTGARSAGVKQYIELEDGVQIVLVDWSGCVGRGSGNSETNMLTVGTTQGFDTANLTDGAYLFAASQQSKLTLAVVTPNENDSSQTRDQYVITVRYVYGVEG